MELRHVRYFLAVAENLHFRKAAESLYMSQPGLSRQIKEMEANLGIKLFERTNRKVSLTKAGLFLKEELIIQSLALDNTFRQAKLIHDGLLGELKLGYVGSAMQEIIPQILLSHRKRYPKIIFSLQEMVASEQIQNLITHKIDVGFMRLQRVPEHLKAFPILTEPFCLVLPIAHPINGKNFKDMSQFKHESFILFDPQNSSAYYEKVMQIFDDSGFSPIVTHRTIHSKSIYKLVENGFGISIVPKSLQNPRLSAIKYVALDNLPQRTTLSVVWNTASRNPILPNFLDEIMS